MEAQVSTTPHLPPDCHAVPARALRSGHDVLMGDAFWRVLGTRTSEHRDGQGFYLDVRVVGFEGPVEGLSRTLVLSAGQFVSVRNAKAPIAAVETWPDAAVPDGKTDPLSESLIRLEAQAVAVNAKLDLLSSKIPPWWSGQLTAAGIIVVVIAALTLMAIRS